MKKLTLRRETIRTLTNQALSGVLGAGAAANSVRTYDLTNCATALCNTSYTATVQCPTILCVSQHCDVLPA